MDPQAIAHGGPFGHGRRGVFPVLEREPRAPLLIRSRGMSGTPESLTLTLRGEPGEPSLEGVLSGGDGAVAIVAPPHPLLGGELSNPTVQALGQGLRRAGLWSLLFNFRGVGESYGDPSGDPEHARADYRAAVAAGSEVSTVLVASGYSFGAAAAIAVAAGDSRLARVVAVAPPPALLSPEDLARLGQRLTVIAAERDTVALAADLERLTLAAGARFEIVAGADHFFGGSLRKVTELAEVAGRSLLA